MEPIKDYIATQFIDNTYNFKCDCLLPIDITGLVKDYKIVGSEIVLCVLGDNGKLVHIGLNTPSLQIERL